MKALLILLLLSSCVIVANCDGLSVKKQEYLAMYARGDISFEEYEDLARGEDIFNKMKE